MISGIQRRAALLGALLTLLLLPSVVPAQGQVRVVVDRDNVNIRIVPALGAELVGTANAGTTFVATGRSPNNEWLQVDFAGGEAWVSTVVVTVLEGDVGSLPIRDPRTIPYGGFEAPRSGFTSATSDIIGRLPSNGVRVRGGPSTAYPVLADALRYTEFPLLGRTADNVWVQVNFEGTLGWVAVRYVEIQDNRAITELPIDGIVADQSPLEFAADDELFGILRLMRDRLDLAQPSLDEIQQVWTDASLGIVPVCGGYPARPTNFNIPRQIYARYFGTLDPLLNDYNAAMTDLRNSIDLLIETCERQGASAALISPPVVTGGLEFVNRADNAFVGLRRRIDELLPEIGPNDCVFAFSGRVDVLTLLDALPTGAVNIITDNFERTENTKGYCFDAAATNVGRIELIRTETNYGLLVAVSPIDDPTNFIASATAGPADVQGANLVIYPVSFPKDGRYIIIVSADIPENEAPTGEYTLLLTDFSFGTPNGTFLTLDEEGNIVIQDVQYNSESGGGTVSVSDGTTLAASNADTTTTTTTDSGSSTGTVTNTSGDSINVYEAASTESAIVASFGIEETAEVLTSVSDWYFIELDSGRQGWVEADSVSFSASSTASTTDTTSTTTDLASSPNVSSAPVLCPGLTLTCDQLFTCVEVQACVNAGSTVLDPNGNGVACDSSDGLNPLSCSVPVSP